MTTKGAYILRSYPFHEYQKASERTMGNPDGLPERERIMIATLGLTGEAGEVADMIKKAFGHGHELDLDKLKKELGDCFWYIAFLCHLCDLDMADVAITNVEKLKARYPEGFSFADSIKRVDVKEGE